MSLLDYLPLLIMPISGLVVLAIAWVLVLREEADHKRHYPAE